jgi:hypothetical protein
MRIHDPNYANYQKHIQNKIKEGHRAIPDGAFSFLQFCGGLSLFETVFLGKMTCIITKKTLSDRSELGLQWGNCLQNDTLHMSHVFLFSGKSN